MATLAQLQTWQTEAENARHALLTGSLVEELSSPSGEHVRYTKADLPRLEAYLADLKAQIASATPGKTPRGPIAVSFTFD